MSHEAGADITEAVAIYNPNGPIAIIAFLVFLVIAIGYWYRHFKTSPRAKYMRPIRYGATFMALGYLCRFTRRDGINAWSWLFETLFILLSPCAFLAQVYLLLPRIATALDAEDCLSISGRALKWIFILADLTTVIAQLAGTALTITFGDLVKIGKWIVTGGLWVQLVFFLCFMTIFAIFTVRVKRIASNGGNLRLGDNLLGGVVGGSKWTQQCRTLIFVMYAACLCMFVRTIYRVAEYTGGVNALAFSETAFYILDALMMLLFIIGFLVVWAPDCLEIQSLPTGMTDKSNRLGLSGVSGRNAGVPSVPVPLASTHAPDASRSRR